MNITEEKFWKKVNKTETCWLWIGSISRRYGQFYAKKTVKAHRFSWELHNGLIPNGLFVCHTCDNPLCVNPSHLWLGTQKDNMKDCVNKERNNPNRGESSGTHKLTEIQIKEIRKSNLTNRELGKIFGVCNATIFNIKNHKKWAYIN